MSGPQREQTPDEQAEAVALSLGRSVLGRDLNTDEAESIALIFKAAVQALRQGFIRRLANHVAAERSDETLEEFFEGTIQTD